MERNIFKNSETRMGLNNSGIVTTYTSIAEDNSDCFINMSSNFDNDLLNKSIPKSYEGVKYTDMGVEITLDLPTDLTQSEVERIVNDKLETLLSEIDKNLKEEDLSYIPYTDRVIKELKNKTDYPFIDFAPFVNGVYNLVIKRKDGQYFEAQYTRDERMKDVAEMADKIITQTESYWTGWGFKQGLRENKTVLDTPVEESKIVRVEEKIGDTVIDFRMTYNDKKEFIFAMLELSTINKPTLERIKQELNMNDNLSDYIVNDRGDFEISIQGSKEDVLDRKEELLDVLTNVLDNLVENKQFTKSSTKKATVKTPTKG